MTRMSPTPPEFRVLPFHAAMAPEMVNVWNAAMGETFPLDDALFRQNAVEDPHFAPAGCAVACRAGDSRVLGFCVAKVAQEPVGADGFLLDRGWISLIAVHPSVQRRGVGSTLLRHAEEFLRARRRRRALLGGDPGHFFPGVPDGTPALGFFAACGYRLRGDAYDLRRPLAEYRTPPVIEPVLADHPDLEVRPLRGGEEAALLAFLDETFPGRWRYIIGRALASGGSVEDVMGVTKGRAVVGFAHLFRPTSRWIGPSIAWTRQAGRRAGGLGPMGLAPGVRARGLGLALLDRAVIHLKQAGVDEMIIDWTILVDFYGKLGFVPWKHYRHGERAL